jgi:hypothetical protein
MACKHVDVQGLATVEQRVKHGPRLIGGGKELAGVFALELDAQCVKPIDGLSNRKGSEHILDDAPIAEEIAGRHRLVGNVASASTRDEHLRAKCLCPIEEDHVPTAYSFGGGDCRGKASSSPSDDHEIRRIHQAHLTRDWSGTAPVA